MEPAKPAKDWAEGGWKLGVLAAACAVLWAAYIKLAFVGFRDDPVWYLEPARNLARGWGLTTRLLYPAQISQFPQGMQLPVLPLHHGPLALLLLGWGYKLFGVADWVPLACSFMATLAFGWVAYRFGREAGGERVGLLAAGLLWINPMILDTNYGALTDPLFTLLINAGVLALWLSNSRDRAWAWAAAAGLALGLASATRLAGQSYWLAFTVSLFWMHPRAPRLWAAFAVPFAGVLGVLALYNHRSAGVWFNSPGIYLLLWSHSFPGFRSSTSYMNLTSGQVLLTYPMDILRKLLTGPLYAINRLLENSQAPYQGAAMLLGLLSDYDQMKARRFRVLCWIFLVPVLLVNIVVSYGDVRYLLPLFPMLTVVASLFLWRFIDLNWGALRPWRFIAASGAVVLLLSPAVLSMKDFWKSRPQRKRQYEDLRALGRWAAESLGPGEVTYTDDPPNLLWHSDRPAVSLTATLEDATKTFAHLPPDALLLTSLRITSEDYDPAWKEAFENRRPILGYQLCRELALPTLRAALYRKTCRP